MFQRSSTKQLFIKFGKTVVNSIKNNSTKIYNNLKNYSSRIKFKKLYKNISEYNDYIKIIILKDGNLLLIKQFQNNIEIFDCHTFKNIKNFELKNCFNNISEAIALNKNEILFCNGYFSIGYIEFDNEYNIKNLYYKNFKNKYFLGSTTLKILKNKKILYMGRKTNYMKEEENFGLTKIYILHFDKIKKDFVLETKINSFVTFFYEFKTKNEFLLNIKKDFYSIVNSKNIKVKKEFKFNINENIRILNDKYFIQIRKGKEINIFNLENFQLIKSSLSNELDTIQNIYASTNNIFFTLEKHFLEYSEDDNYFIKKWEFNEEKNEIIYLGYIKINEKTKILNKIKRINDKDNIYIIEYDLGFVIIKMFSN